MRAPSPQGFTLIEMMVVLSLIALLIGMVVPRMSRRSPSQAWPNILDQLNQLAQLARQESVAEQKIFRISFTRGKNNTPAIVVVEHQVGMNQKTAAIEFAQFSSPYLPTQYDFAQSISIKAIYQGKKEIYQENGQAFCYCVPDGLTQDIYVQLVRNEDDKEEGVTLKMDPFDGQFVLIEKLVRPGQEE